MSMLQLVTAMGWLMATLLRVRRAAKRRTGLLLDRNSCLGFGEGERGVNGGVLSFKGRERGSQVRQGRGP